MMLAYATPEGIHRLRLKIQDFAVKGEKEIMHVVFKQVNRTMDRVAAWATQAAGKVEKELAPLRPLIREATRSALDEFPHDSLTDEELMPSPHHAALVERVNSELSYDASEGHLIHDGMLSEDDAIPANIFGAFATVKSVLTTFQSLLPTAITNLKMARTQVNAVQAVVHSIFATFLTSGPPVFYQASKAYDTLWIVYFVLLAVVTIGVLCYGFYSNNMGQSEDDEAPEDARGKCSMICDTCCCCFGGQFTGAICFWSILIIAQVGVLLLFLVAILLCILAGVKNFIASGCSQIYILGDPVVCTETLKMLQTFLTSFRMGDIAEFDVEHACVRNTLLACQELGPKMATSATLTIIGGLGGAVISFQMIVDTCINFTRGQERKRFMEEYPKEKLP